MCGYPHLEMPFPSVEEIPPRIGSRLTRLRHKSNTNMVPAPPQNSFRSEVCRTVVRCVVNMDQHQPNAYSFRATRRRLYAACDISASASLKFVRSPYLAMMIDYTRRPIETTIGTANALVFTHDGNRRLHRQLQVVSFGLPS